MNPGVLWRVERHRGTYFVQVRRRGVEPSGGCLLGFTIRLLTRLRWQASDDRAWSVEVVAPMTARRPLLTQRRLLHETYDTEDAAVEAAAKVLKRVERGDFDDG